MLPWLLPLALTFAPPVLMWLTTRHRRRYRLPLLLMWLVTLAPVFVPIVQALTAPSLDVPYARLITYAANYHGVEPELLAAVVEQESAFNPDAVSPVGAMGLSQLMPGTAQDLGISNPFDPEQNLLGGARYLSMMLERYEGDLRLAVASYNAGPGAVDRCMCIPQNGETPGYVRRVLALYVRNRGDVGSLYPVDYRLVSNVFHGEGAWPGRDYVTDCGAVVLSPISGLVTRKGVDHLGNTYLHIAGAIVEAVVMHGDYSPGVGQFVYQGESVGIEASNGNSTECHTHLSIRVSGVLIDPVEILR